MENIQLTERQKNIAFAIIVLITLLFSYLLLNALDNSGKHQLSVVAVPSDAHISINGVDAKNKTSLPSGVYTIVTSKDGFLTDTQTLTVKTDTETGALLRPVSEEAKKWSQENNSQYPEGYDYTNDQQPILNNLPYSNFIYSIIPDDATVLSPPLKLSIKSLPGYYNAPFDKIRLMGYDPENYIYTFNYKDPFK